MWRLLVIATIITCTVPVYGATGDKIIVGPFNGFANISTSNLKVRSTIPADTVKFIGSGGTVVTGTGKNLTINTGAAFSAYSSKISNGFANKFIVQTAAPELPNAQIMGTLTTGLVKNTTTTGVQSIALPNIDYTQGTAGLFAQPTITDNGNGTITVGSTTCMLYDNANFTGGAKYYTITGGTFTPINNISSTLAIDYNGGTPIMQIQVQGLSDFSSNIPIVTIYRSGNNISFLSWDSTAQGLSDKILERLVRTQRFARQSGLSLGEIATRTITITAGITYNGVTKIYLDACSSATDPTTLWAHVAGVYTPSTITQYNNTQYDNGTDLVTLTANRYAVNWIYRQEAVSPGINVLIGTGDYTLSQAIAAQPPATVPDVIRTHSVLVGRIIVQKNASSAYQISSAFVTPFEPSPISSHADLTNLDYASAGHTGFVPDTRTVNGQALSADVVVSDITGNSGTATALATGRTISISGPITYTSPAFDGSGDVTAAATVTSQTGTGSTFVMSTSPTITTPTTSGALSVNGGTNIVYYCDAGASVGNLCRGNGCSCSGGTWVATSLKID